MHAFLALDAPRDASVNRVAVDSVADLVGQVDAALAMAGPRLATVALAVLLAAALASPPVAVRAAMSCTTVYNTLMPCLPFVQMGGAMPPQPCCGGIRSLLKQANNTPDRRTICGCLKNVASSAAGSSSTYIDRAAALPGKCGVNPPYKISNRVDCNTIN